MTSDVEWGFPGGFSDKEFSLQCRGHRRQVQSLGQKNPLEKEMATHSMDRESHGQRSLMGYSPQGHEESDTAETT